VQFRILGPLEAGNGRGGVAIETPKPRALLGVLLLHPNEVVSSERLIDELWGERPPATAPKLVQTYVSQLRRELGAETIETRAPGYLLPVGDDELDAVCFRRLAAEGRRLAADDDHDGARRAYREALGLWRGPPLADVLFESFARNEVDQLEEERLASVMELIDCELALGRHADVVPELEMLVGQHPLREQLRAQLMLALYRSGRQAEALAAYRDSRRILVDELGLEPGPELQNLEQQVLTHDPALAAPPRRPVRNGRPAADRLIKGWRAGAVVAAAGLAVSLLLAFVLADRGHTSIRLAPNHIGFIDARSGRVTRSFAVGREPRALALGFGSVWVADYRDQTITRVDPRTGTTATIPVGGNPTGIATAGGAVWAWTLEGLLVRIDPRFNEADRSIRLQAQTEHVGMLGGIVAGGGFLWVAAPPTAVFRVDTANPRRHARFVPAAGAGGPIAYWDDRAWVAGSGEVVPVDARTLTEDTEISVGDARGLAFADGSLWVVSGGPGHMGGVVQALRRVNLESGLIDYPFRVGSDPFAVTVAAGSIWAASRSDGTVSRIDPSQNKLVETVSVGASPTALAADRDGVWVVVE
jgi:DNA-binding SARP family transcriptional activator/DNA-binding beta-propeller fold protein YncE